MKPVNKDRIRNALANLGVMLTGAAIISVLFEQASLSTTAITALLGIFFIWSGCLENKK